MELRPYQKEAVEAVYNHIRTRNDNPCIVLPTGTGKSCVLAQIAKDATQLWNGRVLILAHVKELLEQNADKVRKLCPELKIGIYSAGLKSRDTRENVIIAGIQSVYEKACELGSFDILDYNINPGRCPLMTSWPASLAPWTSYAWSSALWRPTLHRLTFLGSHVEADKFIIISTVCKIHEGKNRDDGGESTHLLCGCVITN